MSASVSVFLLFSYLALHTACQAQPYRQGVTVLRDSCPSKADLASQTSDPAISSVLSKIATRIANGTGTGQLAGFGLCNAIMCMLHCRYTHLMHAITCPTCMRYVVSHCLFVKHDISGKHACIRVSGQSTLLRTFCYSSVVMSMYYMRHLIHTVYATRPLYESIVCGPDKMRI